MKGKKKIKKLIINEITLKKGAKKIKILSLIFFQHCEARFSANTIKLINIID